MPILTRRRLLGGGALLAAVAATGHVVPDALADSTGATATTPFRFQLPEPTGPYPVGTTELHLVDRARADPWVPERTRELMVSLWYPTRPGHNEPLAPYLRPGVATYYDRTVAPAIGLSPGQVDFAGVRTHARTGAAAAPHPGGRPVVLYSPGFGVPRVSGTALVEELVSRGYVVVTVDHTYEASAVEFPDGRVAPQTLPEQSDDRLRKAMKVRGQDMRFVLDQLTALASERHPDAGRLPRGLGAAVGLSRVGMFGHSAGGVGAADVMYADRRVHAGIDMDGFLDYGDDAPPSAVAEQGLDRPFLVMGSVLAGGRPRTHHTNPLWRWLWERSTGPMLDLNVPAGKHYTFTDYQAILPQLDEALGLADGVRDTFIGTVDPARILASLRAYVVAFFGQHLRGRPQRLLTGPSPHHPDVTFIR